jgi:hypothetical protein
MLGRASDLEEYSQRHKQRKIGMEMRERVLRIIFGLKRKYNMLGKQHNEKLHNLYSHQILARSNERKV